MTTRSIEKSLWTAIDAFCFNDQAIAVAQVATLFFGQESETQVVII